MTKWMSEYLGGGFGFIGKTNSELGEIYMLCKRTKLFFSNIRRLVLASIRKALRKIQLSTIEKLVLQWVDCFSFVSYDIHALASIAVRIKNFKCRMYIFGSNQNPTARALTMAITIEFSCGLRLA